MKTLLIAMTCLLSIQAANAQCSITLYKKTPTSKTAYTKDGDSISQKVRKKLSKDCQFNLKLMSVEQKRQMDISKLKKRLKKLQKGL